MERIEIPHYVVGFIFNEDRTGLLLLHKQRPLWQKGLLNGVGGLIEENENPKEAMIRESLEEIGVTPPAWAHFATLLARHHGDDRVIHYYYAIHTETLRNVKQLTDESPVKIHLRDLPQHPTVPNVKWLVTMALSMEFDTASAFTIAERHQQPASASPILQPAVWAQSEDNNHFLLTHALLSFGAVHHRPQEGINGDYLWIAHVNHDCRINGELPITGRAFSAKEAMTIVETLLVNTQTHDRDQLPPDWITLNYLNR
jgi:8-oxo-dGTP diphosphatase